MKYALYFLLVSISSTAFSADVWSGRTKINAIYPTSSGMRFITEFSHPVSTCSGSKRFQLDDTSGQYQDKVAALIAAFMANKDINMLFDNQQTATCAAFVDRFIVYQR